MNRRKKILYLITKSNWGGAQRYVYDLATNISANFDVAVGMGGNGKLKEKLDEAGIRTIPIIGLERDIKLLREFTVLIRIFVLIKKEKPDILHINSSKIGGLGAFAGRILGVKKIIFTAHGWAFEERWRNIFERTMIRILSRLTIVFSHFVIVISEHDENRAVLLHGDSGKIVKIYNGIGEYKLKSRENARKILQNKTRPGGAGGHVWIGTIAELHKNKGLEYAIGALAHIGAKYQFRYLIISDGEDRKRLEEIIKRSGLKNRVFLLGHIPNASEYLNAFDMFVLPSVKEGLPYVILEAGMAGIPTIATDVGGIPEIITDMESGILVRPKNTGEIEKAISYLMDNKEKRGLMGNNLRFRVKTGFSIDEMIKSTTKLYRLKT